jgi:predicted kinase
MNSDDDPHRPMPLGTTIMVLRGLPGSGKSTVAAHLAATTPRTVVVCRDTIREIYFHRDGKLDIEDENTVTELETRQALDHLAAGFNVVIDSTNLAPAYVHRWQQLAATLAIACVLVDVHAPLETCLARVAGRQQTGGRGVPAQVIRDLYRRHPPETWCPPADHSVGERPVPAPEHPKRRRKNRR